MRRPYPRPDREGTSERRGLKGDGCRPVFRAAGDGLPDAPAPSDGDFSGCDPLPHRARVPQGQEGRNVAAARGRLSRHRGRVKARAVDGSHGLDNRDCEQLLGRDGRRRATAGHQSPSDCDNLHALFGARGKPAALCAGVLPHPPDQQEPYQQDHGQGCADADHQRHKPAYGGALCDFIQRGSIASVERRWEERLGRSGLFFPYPEQRDRQDGDTRRTRPHDSGKQHGVSIRVPQGLVPALPGPLQAVHEGTERGNTVLQQRCHPSAEQGAISGAHSAHTEQHWAGVPQRGEVRVRSAHLPVRLAAQQLHLTRSPGGRPVPADLPRADAAVQGPPEARGGGLRVQHIPAHAGERELHLRAQAQGSAGVPEHMQGPQESGRVVYELRLRPGRHQPLLAHREWARKNSEEPLFAVHCESRLHVQHEQEGPL
mmetsp:Transcript_21546/g.48783  ORF Transcript_21546/g.48783 Transcript_21546/m.48783 type:complete len:429 (-) Transcript_21546:596-1882(-)